MAGRQPLHIAAYRDDTQDAAICKFLTTQGAKNNDKDIAGNTPSELASRSNRRISKDVIEESTGTAVVPSRDRRRSRDSREPPPPAPAPSAA